MRKKKHLLACEENLLVWLNFLRAEILWLPLNTKIGMTCCVFYNYFVMILPDIAQSWQWLSLELVDWYDLNADDV